VDRPSQPADDDARVHPRHRLVWMVASVGLAVGLLVVLLLLCVVGIPEWLYPSLTEADLQGVSDPAKVQELKGARLKLQNDARATLVQGVGALLVLTGASIGARAAFRQVAATREQIKQTARSSHDQLQLSEQGQVTDRYTKAIDQLDEKKALAVRLGGLYALERIARDSPEDRATIAEVLCAYVRTAPRRRPPTGANDAASPVVDEPLTVRAPDVHAALTILGRWQRRLGELPPVLDLYNADLQGARLVGVQLPGATLTGVELQRSSLDRAQLQRARLNGAQLQGASLYHAQLQGVSLYSAQLQGTGLDGAQLQEARLDGAQLQRASLAGVQLQGASLKGAQLQGAWASEATGWPEGWDRARAEAAGVRFNG
jgi:Pentapeptide repeats (9 copies)